MSDELINHYTTNFQEDNRLQGFSLEKIRTMELIQRHLPSGKLDIVDVGGGTGVYSFWLSEQRHRVTLLDPVPLQVEQARNHSLQNNFPLIDAVVGDARELPFDSELFDAALMLGPLYHLTEREDRSTALNEAYRVLRPGGLLFAVSISQFASLFNGFYFNLIQDPQFVPMMIRDLKDGQHRPPNPKYFTNTIFHHPTWLKDEIVQSNFQLEAFYAFESFADYIPNLSAFQEDETRLELLLDSIRKVESDETLLGLTCHNMAVAVKR